MSARGKQVAAGRGVPPSTREYKTSMGEEFSLSPGEDLARVREILARFDVAFDLNWSGGQPAVVRMAHFPGISLSIAKTPTIDVEWERLGNAANEATILVARVGGIRVDSNVRSIAHGTRAVLILPGFEPVRMQTTEATNEYVSAAFPISLLPPGIMQLGASVKAPPFAWARLAPVYNFIAATSSVSVSVDDGVNMVLFSAVREVLSTLATMLTEGVAVTPGLYDRALQHLRNFSHDCNTNLDSLAETLGVSPRKLQSAFAQRDTTVTKEIRKLRAAEAHRLRVEHSHLSPEQVATMTGFTSLSAMYRALRAEQLP